MAKTRISFEKVQEDFCRFVDSLAKFNFYTRSVDIQNKKVAESEEYIRFLKELKKEAVKKNNEHVANHIFHMQCMVNALRSSLLMWISIKESEFEDAWSHLVDAQEYTVIAKRLNDYEGIRNLEAHLKSEEEAIFPGWKLYNSPGFVETIGKCSICYELFSVCDHIENEIYMGSLCQRIDRKIIRTDHSALVENPRDRRCIITKISDDDGNKLDYFTWKETGEKFEDKDNFFVEGCILRFSTLDFQ